MLSTLSKFLRLAQPSQAKYFSIANSQPAKYDVETPVWMKPYDAAKYEVPIKHQKKHSGYAFIDLEPFPKSKIMKIGYIILDKLKQIDENELFRIYQEEKTRWIMEKTDEIENLEELESVLGVDSIERFILFWKREIQLVDHMVVDKPWEMHPTEQEMKDQRIFESERPEFLRHEKYEKPSTHRPTEFLDSGSK